MNGLNDELQRIADRAPVVVIDAGTWKRGRSSRRRRLVAGIAATAAVVAVLGGTLTALTSTSNAPIAGSTGGALPARLWGLPGDEVVTPQDDLAIGTVSAAYVATDDQGDGRVVAVTADDGRYHVITLDPDFTGFDNNAAAQPLALSPDGRSLAYSYAGPTPAAGRPTPTGIRIVDLASGTERTVPLAGGQGILVGRMTWSPDGSWLVWSGQVSTRWSGPGRTFGDEEAAGLVAPGADISTPLPSNPDPDSVRQYAVGDDGRVAMLDPDRMAIWRNGETVAERPTRPRGAWSVQALVEGDTVLDMRSTGRGDMRLVQHTETDVAGPPALVSMLVPLGWTADGHALATLVDGASDDEPAIVSSWLDPTSRVTYQGPVVALEDGQLPSLAVAAALPVDGDLPDPSWADDGSSDVWWWALGAGVLALVGGALLVVRRYRAAR